MPSSILFEKAGQGSSLWSEVSLAVEGSPEPVVEARVFKVAGPKGKKEQLQR